MEAQAWTAIALLGATLVGTVFWLGNRIDALAARIDGQGDTLGARIDAQSARIDSLATHVADLTAEVRIKANGLTIISGVTPAEKASNSRPRPPRFPL
jgi:hypothetical protein